MKWFGRKETRRSPEESAAAATDEGGVIAPEADTQPTALEGERGIPSINRQRSLQSRISSVLAFGLMLTLGAGFLVWYYSRTMDRPEQSRQAAEAATRSRAEGHMPLPSLGPIAMPEAGEKEVAEAAEKEAADDEGADGTGSSNPDAAAVSVESEKDRTPELAIDSLLGPPPPLEAEAPEPVAPAVVPTVPFGGIEGEEVPASYTSVSNARRSALERRLSGPAFATRSTSTSSAQMGTGDPATDAALMQLMSSPAPGPGVGSTASQPASGAESAPGNVVLPAEPSHLQARVTPAVMAEVLPTRRFLIPKGAFLDCTLETAIDSTLPGMTTCITAVDTFGADGKVVLLERGTKLFGETKGDVARGAPLIYVLWTEARTPDGVVVRLASPGTDELGRAGLPGRADRHFWERFGAAILISAIEGGVEAWVESQREDRGTTVIYDSSGTRQISTEALKATTDRPPTVRKNQGDRIQIVVARDLDFRSVYELRLAGGAGG